MLSGDELEKVSNFSQQTFCVGLYGGALIDSEGGLVAWGEGIDVPKINCRATSISGGYEHFVVLLETGRVVEFGDVKKPTPKLKKAAKAVSAGCGFTAAIVGDALQCWGVNNVAVSPPKKLKHPPVAISSGYSHAAAILTDGSVIVWGGGGDMFGDQTSTSLTPPPLPNKAITVCCGAFHVAALLSDNTVVAWGSNTFGQCTIPVVITPDLLISQLCCGFSSTGVLTSDGRVFCWGRCSPPSLDGIPDLGTGFIPPASGGKHREGRIVRISLGNKSSAASTDSGTLLLWGDDAFGRATSLPQCCMLTDR